MININESDFKLKIINIIRLKCLIHNKLNMIDFFNVLYISNTKMNLLLIFQIINKDVDI